MVVVARVVIAVVVMMKKKRAVCLLGCLFRFEFPPISKKKIN